jgi:hypothetical protein
MKIDKQFNKLSLKEYIFFIDNHKKYTDLNTLGLYRSIAENEKLTLAEKLELREYTHAIFKKSFDFLVLKDPMTYMAVSTLGEEMTKADERQLWKEVQVKQLEILNDKKLGHRNFGTYSKHICGQEGCPYEGLMTQKGSFFAYHNEMQFDTDKQRFGKKLKSKEFKKERKAEKEIILKNLTE